MLKKNMRWVLIIWLIALSMSSWAAAQRPASHDGMARILGGSFEMGIDGSDIPRLQEKFNIKRAELFTEEIPRHSVSLASFYFDRTEVTNQAFKRFVEKNPEWRKDRIDPSLHNGKYL